MNTNKLKNSAVCAALALLIGAAVGVISAFFGISLHFVEKLRAEHVFLFIPFLGVCGMAVLWMYKHFSPNSEQGLNLAIAYNMGMVDKNGKINDSEHLRKIGKYPNGYVILKLISNLAMLLFGASTGKEGTIAACGAAVGDYTSRIFNTRRFSRTLLIAGVSAGVAGLFQTPLGGMFFALEFTAAGLLAYSALIPALIAAFTSYFVSGLCGYTAFHHTVSALSISSPKEVLFIVICAAAFGITGTLFTLALHGAEKLYKHNIKNRYIGIFTVGCIMAAIFLLIHQGRYSGTGAAMFGELFENAAFHSYDFVLKFIFTIICLTAGFSGGEMMPLLAIGASLGALMSSITGLPLELTAAMGACAVYSSATNTLLAPIFIGIEMFGTECTFCIVIACVIAYAINGNHSVYSRQGVVRRSIYGHLTK